MSLYIRGKGVLRRLLWEPDCLHQMESNSLILLMARPSPEGSDDLPSSPRGEWKSQKNPNSLPLPKPSPLLLRWSPLKIP